MAPASCGSLLPDAFNWARASFNWFRTATLFRFFSASTVSVNTRSRSSADESEFPVWMPMDCLPEVLGFRTARALATTSLSCAETATLVPAQVRLYLLPQGCVLGRSWIGLDLARVSIDAHHAFVVLNRRDAGIADHRDRQHKKRKQAGVGLARRKVLAQRIDQHDEQHDAQHEKYDFVPEQPANCHGIPPRTDCSQPRTSLAA